MIFTNVYTHIIRTTVKNKALIYYTKLPHALYSHITSPLDSSNERFSFCHYSLMTNNIGLLILDFQLYRIHGSYILFCHLP